MIQEVPPPLTVNHGLWGLKVAVVGGHARERSLVVLMQPVQVYSPSSWIQELPPPPTVNHGLWGLKAAVVGGHARGNVVR